MDTQLHDTNTESQHMIPQYDWVMSFRCEETRSIQYRIPRCHTMLQGLYIAYVQAFSAHSLCTSGTQAVSTRVHNLCAQLLCTTCVHTLTTLCTTLVHKVVCTQPLHNPCTALLHTTYRKPPCFDHVSPCTTHTVCTDHSHCSHNLCTSSEKF